MKRFGNSTTAFVSDQESSRGVVEMLPLPLIDLVSVFGKVIMILRT